MQRGRGAARVCGANRPATEGALDGAPSSAVPMWRLHPSAPPLVPARDEARKGARRMSGHAGQVQEHMEVVGSDGGHVGTVDHVEGDRIKLTRKDDPDGS